MQQHRTCWLLLLSFVLFVSYTLAADTYNGPFKSWINVKINLTTNAVGDGTTDDSAAIQSALDRTKILSSGSKVIYFPAGTYRILTKLKMEESSATRLIGEDPATTILLWDGSSGGTLFETNSIVESKIERLTFDGNNKAGNVISHAWDGSIGFGCSGVFYGDVVIKNSRSDGFGINAGISTFQVSEISVVRTQFLNLGTAVSLNNGNVLNWWFREVTVKNCGKGIWASFGEFFIRDSIFQNNRIGDAGADQSCVFALRGSTSLNSGYFANFNGNANFWSHVTLQRNVIEGQNGSLVDVYLSAPFVMMDDTIKVRQSGWASYGWCLNLGLIGEQHQSPQNPGFRINGPDPNKHIVVDSDFTATLPSVSLPSSPATPPFVSRTVYEVTSFDDVGLQAAIDAALASNGQSPVVHMTWGTYILKKTVVVPPNFDVQIIGDSIHTFVRADDALTDPMFIVQGPSLATFRDFQAVGNTNNEIFVVQNCDQPDSQIYLENCDMASPVYHSLFADKLAYGLVLCRECQMGINAATPGSSAIRVYGRGKTADTSSEVHLLAGTHGASSPVFEVGYGGVLLVRDGWNENPYPTSFRGIGEGRFIGQSSRWVTYDTSESNDPLIDVNNYYGSAVFSGIYFGTPADKVVDIQTDIPERKILFFTSSADGDWYRDNSGNVNVKRVACNANDGGQAPIPNLNFDLNNATDIEWLREMLAPVRAPEPQRADSVPAGSTNLVFRHVFMSKGTVQVHLYTGNPNVTYPDYPTFTSAASSTFSWTAALQMLLDFFF